MDRDREQRPSEPEHPMSLEGGITAGDTAFMLRCLFEEYLRGGCAPDELWAMCRDAKFQALFAARLALGDGAARALLDETARDVGVHRASAWERASVAEGCPSAGTSSACESCSEARGG